MAGEQKIRAVLYYLSVTVFFAGLPFILSYTLGYKFNPATWRFTRTGLVSLKSQPPGAAVYINGAPLNEKTPCSINELLPGSYRIELKLPGYYPYTAQAGVAPSAVTRLEKILLFPLRPDVQKINKEEIAWFWIEENREIFYVAADSASVFRSDLDGERFEKVADCVPLRPPAKSWIVSPDRRRILYHNDRQIGIAELQQEPRSSAAFVLDMPAPVTQVFWYSDSYNIIAICGEEICMLEAHPGARPFGLIRLNAVPAKVFYDREGEALYFQDPQTGADDKAYENVYKLELGRKLNPFPDFMRMRTGREGQRNE